MTRLLIADIEKALKPFNLTLSVGNPSKSRPYKYIIKDADSTTLFGVDTLAEIAERLEAYRLTLATEAEPEIAPISEYWSLLGVDRTGFDWELASGGLALSKVVYPFTCDVCHGQSCDLPEQNSELDYWDAWWLAFKNAKRQAVGAAAAAAHVVVMKPVKQHHDADLIQASGVQAGTILRHYDTGNIFEVRHACEMPTEPPLINIGSDGTESYFLRDEWFYLESVKPSEQIHLSEPSNISNKNVVSPVIIGIYFLAAIALLIEGVAWIATEVVKERLIQRVYAFVTKRHEHHAQSLKIFYHRLIR